LTDRAGWAICLVGAPGDGERLGIDLELVEPRTERFVDDYLTPAEQKWVRSRSRNDDRDAAANLVWSAKEAALKVLQVGLRADTRTIEVTVHDGDATDTAGWAPLTMVGRGERFHGWWRRDGAFVLTIASRSPVEPPTPLPGSADLGDAMPQHSWLDRPLA
jgi:4'-phosphopantetheinyl transferase